MPQTVKVVTVYLPTGIPQALRIAELRNWTGVVLACPRSDLAGLGQRDEGKQTGIYILQGFDDKAALPRVYIGEADNVWDRLRSHDGYDQANGALVQN